MSRKYLCDFPQIIKEWNYSKNTKSPYDVLPKSNKKVWWKCEKEYEWEATTNN